MECIIYQDIINLNRSFGKEVSLFVILEERYQRYKYITEKIDETTTVDIQRLIFYRAKEK